MLDDAPDPSHKRLRQSPSTQIKFTEGFYNLEGDIIVQRSDINDSSIVSNNSSTSSGSRQRTYRQLTKKERSRSRHKSKISWWDDPVMNYVNSEPNPHFPSNPDTVQSNGPVNKLESQIRGVPIEIESEIKALISDSELETNDESVPEIVNNDFRLQSIQMVVLPVL